MGSRCITIEPVFPHVSGDAGGEFNCQLFNTLTLAAADCTFTRVLMRNYV